MKKFLLSISIFASLAIIVTACNTNPISLYPGSNIDTAGLAQFKEWKAQEAQALVAKQNRAANAAVRKAAPAINYTMSSGSAHQAKVPTKKGWSKSAKYGVIGGIGGGILGAVINKKDPVKGGIIGAVVLGGGGYILGRSQDKKDGRL